MAWVGAELETNPALFDEHLSSDDIADIEAAVKHFQGLGLARGFANPETFPLSEELASRLRAITSRVYDGRGFHRIRGLDTSRYTEEERVIAYAGITSYVADERARNIDHIRDRSFANPMGDKLKPLELAVSMTFHTDIDVGDILSMFIQSTPLSGGEQYIASISSVYNYIAQREPEVLKALADDWYWERSFRPEVNKEITRVFNRPLLAFEDDHLQINFAATFVGGNPAYDLSDDAPPLTPEKRRALVVIQEAAKATCLRLTPEPGDMIFINNYAMLHARATWTDSMDDVWKQRYVMRLWLRDSQKGWKSAVGLKRKLDENFDLGPDAQGLFTGNEWNALPRAMRVKEMGVTADDCHD
ncbi:hypothetical protein BGZ61DRAFT_497744 [Ilyonectria robusta]|uniref:uncharacterized protein n=1 Tax=Ilyonectria robusta TaxID=1079257 RepID=UPI001E8D67C8|nr:uncharacterized protein BGZ61DRAFT_497744 [Ilyonectria robusta]KAH8670608.1 hypothetical protein BGZ61DRAFT_497744 [Ilyonectria robusta]